MGFDESLIHSFTIKNIPEGFESHTEATERIQQIISFLQKSSKFFGFSWIVMVRMEENSLSTQPTTTFKGIR